MRPKGPERTMMTRNAKAMLTGLVLIGAAGLAGGVGSQPEKSAPSRPSPAELIEQQKQQRAAQEAEYAAQMAAREAERAALDAAIRGPLIDVEFGGGRMGALIEMIQRVTTPRPNIVADSEVHGLTVGSLMLKQVSVRDALTAAITAADAGSIGAKLDIIAPREPNPLYRVVISSRSTQFFGPPSPRPILQVFPIKEWAGTPEVTLSAIETALSLQGGNEKTKVSFHKDSGLLFVSGSQQDAETVKNVLDGLEQRANAARANLDRNIAINLVNAVNASDPEAALTKVLEWKGKAEQLEDVEKMRANERIGEKAREEARMRELEDVRKRAEVVPGEMRLQIEKLHIDLARVQAINHQLQSERDHLSAQLEAFKAEKVGGK